MPVAILAPHGGVEMPEHQVRHLQTDRLTDTLVRVTPWQAPANAQALKEARYVLLHDFLEISAETSGALFRSVGLETTRLTSDAGRLESNPVFGAATGTRRSATTRATRSTNRPLPSMLAHVSTTCAFLRPSRIWPRCSPAPTPFRSRSSGKAHVPSRSTRRERMIFTESCLFGTSCCEGIGSRICTLTHKASSAGPAPSGGDTAARGAAGRGGEPVTLSRATEDPEVSRDAWLGRSLPGNASEEADLELPPARSNSWLDTPPPRLPSPPAPPPRTTKPPRSLRPPRRPPHPRRDRRGRPGWHRDPRPHRRLCCRVQA